MNKEYRELFQLVARNGAMNAEGAIATYRKDKENDHKSDIEILTKSIQSFNAIEDKLKDGKEIDDKDYLMLYTGALVSRELIQKNINTWTAVVKEYNENLIPKIKEVALEQDSGKKKILIEEFFS